MSGDERDRIPDPGAPATEEEVAASQKLRDALEEDPIASALKAAWAPEPIAAEAHEEIVDAAIAADAENDPIVAALKAAWAPTEIYAEAHQRILDDLPTAEELRLAPLVEEDDMVAALKAAWNPTALGDADHQRIVDRALAGAVVTLRPARSRLRVAIVTTSTVLALAAGFILFVQTQETRAPRSEVALAKARTTQPLFDEPFHAGETSARIDKIAIARAADYRDNYFAKRGVK
jgi:hypothetical protein